MVYDLFTRTTGIKETQYKMFIGNKLLHKTKMLADYEIASFANISVTVGLLGGMRSQGNQE